MRATAPASLERPRGGLTLVASPVIDPRILHRRCVQWANPLRVPTYPRRNPPKGPRRQTTNPGDIIDTIRREDAALASTLEHAVAWKSALRESSSASTKRKAFCAQGFDHSSRSHIDAGGQGVFWRGYRGCRQAVVGRLDRAPDDRLNRCGAKGRRDCCRTRSRRGASSRPGGRASIRGSASGK